MISHCSNRLKFVCRGLQEVGSENWSIPNIFFISYYYNLREYSLTLMVRLELSRIFPDASSRGIKLNMLMRASVTLYWILESFLWSVGRLYCETMAQKGRASRILGDVRNREIPRLIGGES